MKKLDVEHFLDIYIMRKDMQEEGITNPSEDIKKFTREFVEKLENMPLNEEIIIKESSFFDSLGNLIIKFPDIDDSQKDS
ncbi:hypothetical protein NZD88_02135 [Chryseobacterium antibioticum]|uniref:Uncharacterized protein n=1 Tax=Chryseobacterium pyrolae TaxID=2987481 RepID=A0ABT2ICM2_9FLAO|nr:hypothetical protein [Chryseobacterium pyrolae]MCT2406352.1 hypothetical protein [Chryseobacterium pyrolae]